jgi:hypothetical protein
MQEKSDNSHIKANIRITADFSTETPKARKVGMTHSMP